MFQRNLLQWGHDLAVMETRRDCEDMPACRCLLQWGHDLAVMETQVVHYRHDTQPFGFNGAMTSRSWRRPDATFESGEVELASMGP